MYILQVLMYMYTSLKHCSYMYHHSPPPPPPQQNKTKTIIFPSAYYM